MEGLLGWLHTSDILTAVAYTDDKDPLHRANILTVVRRSQCVVPSNTIKTRMLSQTIEEHLSVF